MSSAIEILKEIKQELINSDKRFGYSGNPKLRYDVLDEAIVALEQKEKLKELLVKEEREANRILVKLENKEQQRLDWDKWWEELKEHYIDYAKKLEIKRLIKEVLELMK